MTTPPSVAATAVAESLVDALLPNRTDGPLEELAAATFIDADVDVPVSPVDQLLVALTRRLLTDPALGQAAVVQLPRAKHRASLLLAITSHLLCRQPPTQFRGPVVLIGFDVDLVEQLRTLSVRNHRRMGLATGNPLSVHRLTRAEDVQPVIGSERRAIDESMVFFNTRVGRPQLRSRPPLVILDGTSVLHPAVRERALEWAVDHVAAAFVTVGDLGDDGLITTMSNAGLVPTVAAVTESVVEDLIATFNRGAPSTSTLSSHAVLWRSPTTVHLRRVPSDEINEVVSRAFEAIGAKPEGFTPPQLDTPLRLLRNGTRLAARVRDYKAACTNNIRPGEMPVPRLLDRRTAPMSGGWRHWEIASLGTLNASTRTLWRLLERDNPKLTELWRTLDALGRATDGRILIRCHSRAAADATRSSLSSGERTVVQQQLWRRLEGRIEFATFKDRFPAASFDAQILTGAPPPWEFSHLRTIEAAETNVLVYDAEDALLRRYGERWASAATGWQQAVCRTVRAAAPTPVSSPLPPLETDSSASAATRLHMPDLGLTDVLDAASTALDPAEVVATPGTSIRVGGGDTKVCVPVHLEGGRTWWCVDDGERSTPVVRVTAAGRPESQAVGELCPGDCIVVPAGEGTESIYSRLVAASRSNDDVRNLERILSQFRSAARAVLSTSRTNREAIERVRVAGAVAADQLTAWAKGTTIAPREPGDVEAVFAAADRPCPDLGLIYAVAGTLRSLNRTLGRFVAALASGRGDDTVDSLRSLVGPVADEILDEFIVETVISVGDAVAVRAHLAGALR